MSYWHLFFILTLIPACAILNHLGGQSTTIPNPRITCRVFGIGLAFDLVTQFLMIPTKTSLTAWGIVTAGMAIWAVFHWGDGFMAITGTDTRNYSKYKWICAICDKICKVNSTSILTPAQCKEWGTWYMTVRGGFMYPMFIALGIMMTPWAFWAGLGCLLQGIVYRTSETVRAAEYKMGALIGLMLSMVLILRIESL